MGSWHLQGFINQLLQSPPHPTLINVGDARHAVRLTTVSRGRGRHLLLGLLTTDSTLADGFSRQRSYSARHTSSSNSRTRAHTKSTFTSSTSWVTTTNSIIQPIKQSLLTLMSTSVKLKLNYFISKTIQSIILLYLVNFGQIWENWLAQSFCHKNQSKTYFLNSACTSLLFLTKHFLKVYI